MYQTVLHKCQVSNEGSSLDAAVDSHENGRIRHFVTSLLLVLTSLASRSILGKATIQHSSITAAAAATGQIFLYNLTQVGKYYQISLSLQNTAHAQTHKSHKSHGNNKTTLVS